MPLSFQACLQIQVYWNDRSVSVRGGRDEESLAKIQWCGSCPAWLFLTRAALLLQLFMIIYCYVIVIIQQQSVRAN